MYLNRAEAYAKEPALGDALADLNVIRTRAHIPALSAGDMKPGKTMLEYVLEERRKELAFEGHRRFDIFRNGLTMNRTYPGTHDRGAATSVRLTISADDPAAIEFILNVRSIHIRESWNRIHKGRNIRWTLVRVYEGLPDKKKI